MCKEQVKMQFANRKSQIANGRGKVLFPHPGKCALVVLAGVLIGSSLTRGDVTRKPTLESIGDQVMCLCGCVATLNHCPHRDCATVAEIRPIIEKDIAEGKDETAILQDLAIRYGVQVLAAPPAKGFSLTAWILPGVGLLAGLSFVVILVRRWRKPAPVAAGVSSKPLDPELLAAVEEEMENSGLGGRN